MRLGVWQKSAVYVTAAAVGGSGLIWFVAHDLIDNESTDITRALLTMHGVASYALLVALGSLLPLHVRSGWRHRRNILTGLATLAMMVILGATALVLYYGSEETHAAARWIHLGFGLFSVVLLPIHALWQTLRRPGAAGQATVQRPESDGHVDSGDTLSELPSL